MTDTSRIIDLGALELSRAIHARTVSGREAMSACLARINALG